MDNNIGERLIAEVWRLAKERPDYQYERPKFDEVLDSACRYVYNGQPSCLVGWAAWNLGLIDASTESETYNVGGVLDLSEELNLDLTSAQMDWLATAQSMQDRGYTWGDAVAQADEDVPISVLTFAG